MGREEDGDEEEMALNTDLAPVRNPGILRLSPLEEDVPPILPHRDDIRSVVLVLLLLFIFPVTFSCVLLWLLSFKSSEDA